MNIPMPNDRTVAISNRCQRFGVTVCLLGIFALGLSCPAVTLAAGFSGTTTIASIDIESGAFVYVLGAARFANPDSCGSSNGAVILDSNPDHNSMLATVLAANTMGEQVQFFLNGCASTAWGFTLPVITTVTLNPTQGEFGP